MPSPTFCASLQHFIGNFGVSRSHRPHFDEEAFAGPNSLGRPNALDAVVLPIRLREETDVEGNSGILQSRCEARQRFGAQSIRKHKDASRSIGCPHSQGKLYGEAQASLGGACLKGPRGISQDR